jgi:hypothetical protein
MPVFINGGHLMKRILPMPTEGGDTISIEVDEVTGAVVRGAGSTAFLDKSAQTFEAVVASVRPVALALVQQFANLGSGTNSIRVKFGIKISAAAGAIIASAGSEANFEVEINWAPGTSK